MSHTQDIVFTLYGDYIHHRGGEAWTGSPIKLLGLFGISGQAVRPPLSHTSHKGWLNSHKVSQYNIYSLTPKCVQLLDEGTQRISQPRPDPSHEYRSSPYVDPNLPPRLLSDNGPSERKDGREKWK